MKKYVFIGSDRNVNAGESDYTKALALYMKENNIAAEDVYFARISRTLTTTFDAAAAATPHVTGLPLTNEAYDSAPVFNAAFIDRVKSAGATDIAVMGLGHSTLREAVDCRAALAETGCRTTLSFTSHILDAEQVDVLAREDARVFVPKSALGDGVTQRLGQNVTALPSVPHTYTEKSCREEYAKLLGGSQGAFYQKLVAEKTPFATVVLNGGFDVGGVWQPYLSQEASAQGYALGAAMPAGTALLLAHGGPRNLQDEKEGHDAMQAFSLGYTMAQTRLYKALPLIVEERFSKQVSYNFIKASFILAQEGRCLTYVSNAEGYGTMAGALSHVPQRVQLGCFMFGAAEKHRAAENEIHHRMGIRRFVPAKNGCDVDIHPRESRGVSSDPAQLILAQAGLIGAAPPAPDAGSGTAPPKNGK